MEKTNKEILEVYTFRGNVKDMELFRENNGKESSKKIRKLIKQDNAKKN